MDKTTRYWLWLASLEKINAKDFYDILAHFEDTQNVWDSVKLSTKAFDFLDDAKKACIYQNHSEKYIDELIDQCKKASVMPITRLDDDYPALLAEISAPPPVLYIKGSLKNYTKKTIAIVGTRRCSRKGTEFVQGLAEDLGRSGVVVASGLARGIDTAAHTGVVKSGGVTFAVLGCGTDVVYPKENQKLYDAITEKGAIISEYLPGTPPLAWNFPLRNRIISGMSRATVIVESQFKGGANITMKYATDQGRDLMAVPGQPSDKQSELPNFIIKNGGVMVQNADDILSEYGWGKTRTKRKRDVKLNIQLDFFEQQIYNLLLQGDLSIEEIENKSKIEPQALYASLTMMEMKGVLMRLPGNVFGIK
ncbi:MAG: DNA-processing protein DprA [Eubacteriales bacterium]